MKIFVTAELSEDVIAYLKTKGEVSFGGWGYKNHRKLTPEELVEQATGAEVLVICYEEINNYVLDHMPSLRFISCTRGGVENIDISAVRSHKDIFICNAPGRNANAVAELTIGLMIAAARFIPLTYHRIMNRDWQNVPWDIAGTTTKKTFAGYELDGKILGLIGYGAIARKVARIGHALGMLTIAYDPYLSSREIQDGTIMVELDELATQSDFVSLHCKSTPETENIINKDFLSLMKKTAILINTARGKLVDEEALYACLENKDIFCAALDTLVSEPINPQNKFLELENVIITPHIGGASYDIKRQQSNIVMEDIKGYFENGKPVNILR